MDEIQKNIEEIQKNIEGNNTPEEKNIRLTKKGKPDTRGKTGWSDERKKLQALRMARINGQKDVKNKNNIDVEPDSVNEEIEENNDIENESIPENESSHSWAYYISMIFILIIAALVAIIFFLKTGSLKEEIEE